MSLAVTLMVLVICSVAMGLMDVDPDALIEDTNDTNIENDQNDVRPRSRPESLKFKILRDDNSEPIKGARISVGMRENNSTINRYFLTDGDGTARFDYLDGNDPVELDALVCHKGFVHCSVRFGEHLEPSELPIEKTIRMVLGKHVGGKIVDQTGQPVATAKLMLETSLAVSPPESVNITFFGEAAEDGSWSFDGIPPNRVHHVTIEHPDFVRSTQLVQDCVDGIYELDRGFTLNGRVVDPDRTPISGVSVTFGRNDVDQNCKVVRSDKNGDFIVRGLNPQSSRITVDAPNFAPQTRDVEISKDTQIADFQLVKGSTTRFHIVDTDGNPISGVKISVDKWKDAQTLQWNGSTDEFGMAHWNDAPPDPVSFLLERKGFASLNGVVAVPQNEPHGIVLLHPLEISGIVVDSQKNKVTHFRVTPGYLSPDNKLEWWTHRSRFGRKGKFEMTFDDLRDEVYFRIEAKGFRPWISKGIPFREGTKSMFTCLEPAP